MSWLSLNIDPPVDQRHHHHPEQEEEDGQDDEQGHGGTRVRPLHTIKKRIAVILWRRHLADVLDNTADVSNTYLISNDLINTEYIVATLSYNTNLTLDERWDA